VKNSDQEQSKWEGNLKAYHSTHDAEALILAKFVYAASAAVWAEKRSAKAGQACLTFPIIKSLQMASNTTSVKTLSVLLQGELDATAQDGFAPLDPTFIVPAAYFYALGTKQAVQISSEARYRNALKSKEDSLLTDFQAAVDAG